METGSDSVVSGTRASLVEVATGAETSLVFSADEVLVVSTNCEGCSSTGVTDVVTDVSVEGVETSRDCGTATSSGVEVCWDNVCTDVVGRTIGTVDEVSKLETVGLTSGTEEVDVAGTTLESEAMMLGVLEVGGTTIGVELETTFGGTSLEGGTAELSLGGGRGTTLDVDSVLGISLEGGGTGTAVEDGGVGTVLEGGGAGIVLEGGGAGIALEGGGAGISLEVGCGGMLLELSGNADGVLGAGVLLESVAGTFDGLTEGREGTSVSVAPGAFGELVLDLGSPGTEFEDTSVGDTGASVGATGSSVGRTGALVGDSEISVPVAVC